MQLQTLNFRGFDAKVNLLSDTTKLATKFEDNCHHRKITHEALAEPCKRQESGFRIPGFRLKTPPEPRTMNPEPCACTNRRFCKRLG